jgi:hypothetical protein
MGSRAFDIIGTGLLMVSILMSLCMIGLLMGLTLSDTWHLLLGNVATAMGPSG